MKKIISFIFILLVLIAVIAAYLTFGTATAFDEKFKSFVVEDGKTDKASVLQTLEQQHIIDNTLVFGLLADRLDVWNRLKPGKFQLKNGDNLFTLAKILRNNRQAEVKLIINKLRTKEDFARLIAKNFATDSITAINYFNNNDSLKQYGVTDKTLFTIVLPNTYSFYYFTPLGIYCLQLTDCSRLSPCRSIPGGVWFWRWSWRRHSCRSRGATLSSHQFSVGYCSFIRCANRCGGG